MVSHRAMMWLPSILVAVSLHCVESWAPSTRTASIRQITLYRNAPSSSQLHASTFSNILDLAPWNAGSTKKRSVSPTETTALEFLEAWNAENYDAMRNMCSDGIVVDDTKYWKPSESWDVWERQLRLEHMANPESLIFFDVQKIIVSDDSDEKSVAIQYNSLLRSLNGETMPLVPGARGALVLDFAANGKITRIKRIQETADKNGSQKLTILKYASKIMDATGYNPAAVGAVGKATQKDESNSSPTIAYFDAWNRRDMKAAIDLFDENVIYDDTAFEPFVGKPTLEKHLNLCAGIFPTSFKFAVDRVYDDKLGTLATEWHVENNGEPLPFTKGCSFYKIEGQRIVEGIDFVEPSPPKSGELSLLGDTLRSNLSSDPARILALVTWLSYMYIVFFSDGILPGANALQLEQRTWEEVRDLSLNFFLVSPILNLPFSPVVHPMLEGVFNLLLSWAAMFAGFLSDDRRDKPNYFGVIPAVVGMQFLTSAFLLPYLVLRSCEHRTGVRFPDLPKPAQVCESRFLGLAMGAVGSGSIVWATLGRSEFGTLSERWTSFLDLLSIDRVGSSFLVDVAIFAVFQSYFIDDDLKRRGSSPESARAVAFVGKYVPFFGLVAYLTLRPDLARE